MKIGEFMGLIVTGCVTKLRSDRARVVKGNDSFDVNIKLYRERRVNKNKTVAKSLARIFSSTSSVRNKND